MTDQPQIPVNRLASSSKGKFFVIQPGYWDDTQESGLEIVNGKKLRLPGSYIIEEPNGDPDQYPEKPHLIHVPDRGGMPRDFENIGGHWIVSEALKQVFESVDPMGFAFSPCDFTLSDGSTGPQYYLCGVLRLLDALDEGASRVKIEYETDHQTGERLKFYSVSGGASLVFKTEFVGHAHIFRQAGLGVDAICDRVLADALAAAHLDGVETCDAADF